MFSRACFDSWNEAVFCGWNPVWEDVGKMRRNANLTTIPEAKYSGG